MSSLHYLDGDEIRGEGGVNETCVECLERLLQKARDGEVVGVVAAAQHADGSTTEALGGFIWNRRVIGELFCLMQRLAT